MEHLLELLSVYVRCAADLYDRGKSYSLSVLVFSVVCFFVSLFVWFGLFLCLVFASANVASVILPMFQTLMLTLRSFIVG